MPHRKLSKAQRQHLEGLMLAIKNAEVAAQHFLGYCAAEAEVEIGRDGWQFNLDEMCFEQAQPDSDDVFSPQSVLAGISGNGGPHA